MTVEPIATSNNQHTQTFSAPTPPAGLEAAHAGIKTGARQLIGLAGQARHDWGAQVATVHLIMARCRGELLENLRQAAFIAGLVLGLVVDPDSNPALEQP